MRVRSVVFFLVLTGIAPSASLLAQQQAPMTSPEERALLHQGPDWEAIAPHLPDPKNSTAAQLELAGDVLRARRFPEDALDYYGYAMARGGNISDLLNKMGVVRLELRQNDLAKVMFERTVKVKKNNAQAWNNLGVTEYASHRYSQAISDYKKASKIDKHAAVYHSNMGMAYFESKDMESARKEFSVALKLDPNIMQGREGGGMTAHVLGTQNYPELCFEMARLYAHNHDPATMKMWIAKAAEGGYDVPEAMRDDTAMAPYLKDEDIKLILQNAVQLHKPMVAVKTPALNQSNM